MKKYLIIFLMLFVCLSVSCGDDPIEEDPVTEVDPINGTHQYLVDGDEVSPYVIVQSVLDQDNNLIYSLTYISTFLNKINENDTSVTLTGRYYDYYQVDYETNSGAYHKYFHFYDYLDSSERAYGQNFMPHYDFKEQLKSLQVLVKYRFIKNDVSYEKEIKFKESILQFDDSLFNNELGNYSFDVFKTTNEAEDFNRYKLEINFDENIKTGHFDIQTWVEIENNIYPFVGYYHYRPNHGNIYTASDIKVSKVHQITKIYFMIAYYNENNDLNYIYYRKDL